MKILLIYLQNKPDTCCLIARGNWLLLHSASQDPKSRLKVKRFEQDSSYKHTNNPMPLSVLFTPFIMFMGCIFFRMHHTIIGVC